MNTTQITANEKTRERISSIVQNLPTWSFYLAIVLIVLVFTPVAISEGYAYKEYGIYYAIGVPVFLLVLEIIFGISSLMMAFFWNQNKWIYVLIFGFMTAGALAFTLYEITVFTENAKLETSLATRLKYLLYLGCALSFLLREGACFMLFMETDNSNQEQETETGSETVTVENNAKTVVTEKEYLYAPRFLYKISDKECEDENGEKYDLTTAKKYFKTYEKRRNNSVNNLKQYHFFNYVVWFIESGRSSVSETSRCEDEPNELMPTSQTKNQQLNGNKIESQKQQSLTF